MLHTLRRRTAAFFLALSLLVLPAQALTVQEAGQLLQDYYIDDVPQDVLNQPTIDAMLDASKKVDRALKAGALAIGGTSVIIVVGVALETAKALEAQMLMRHYKGFLE